MLACVLATASAAELPRTWPKAGEIWEITLDRRMKETTSDASSSGSSTDVDTIIERVIAVNERETEVEFDLPRDASAQERAAVWQLPARVALPVAGSPRLLNAAALEARIDPWLKKAGWTRAQCGKGIFTWNYFVIECDSQSVLRMVERFEPDPVDLRENAVVSVPGAEGSASLRLRSAAGGGTVLVATMPVDAEAVRRSRAETAVTVAELSSETLTTESALQAPEGEHISGTIEVTFEISKAGSLRQRTTVSRVATRKPTGVIAIQTVTEVLSRRCIAGCP